METQRWHRRKDARSPEILEAALACFAEKGFAATRMDDIAARAGVGKAAIYRRWSSKAALMTDVLVYWRPDLRTDDAPDTGSLGGDLEALIDRAVHYDNTLITNDLVLRVAVEATRDPQLATAFDDLMLLRGRRIVSAILARAVARGEISADRDWSLVADVLTAMSLLRVLNGQTADADFMREVIDTLVLPALST